MTDYEFERYEKLVAQNEAASRTIADLRAKLESHRLPQLAVNQPCGCVLCVCHDEEKCHGCGAKNCGTPDCVLKGDRTRVLYMDEPSYSQLRSQLEEARASLAAYANRTMPPTNEELRIVETTIALTFENERLTTNNAQLRLEWTGMKSEVQVCHDKISTLEAENDRLAGELERGNEAVDYLQRNGYRRCDIPACNCNSWHGGNTHERLREIRDTLEDAYIDLNGKTILSAVVEIVKSRDEAVDRRLAWKMNAEASAKTCTMLEKERDEARADLKKAHGWLCGTCNGSGMMSVLANVLPPDEREIYVDEICAECGGNGFGQMRSIEASLCREGK